MTSPDPRPRTRRRLSTLLWGAIPVVALGALINLDSVPGTDVSLTVPYAAQGPGPTFNTLGEVDGQDVVAVSGPEVDETEGNMDMTTVSVRTNMTLAQALGRWLFTDDDLIPIEMIFPPDVSPEEVERSNEAAFTSSEAAATVAAMGYLDVDVEIYVVDVVEDSAAEGRVQADDVIRAVDGESMEQPNQVAEAVQAKSPGDTVTLTLERAGGAEEVDVVLGENPDDPETAMLGILMGSQPVEDIEVEYNLNDVGGPSAGMMFSLAVIDKLSPGELNGGRYVAGTGTISPDGAVGPIGGIAHKVDAAEEEGAELFLAPRDNCAEAVSRDHGDLVVAAVDTLDHAIEQMEAFDAGGDVDVCEP